MPESSFIIVRLGIGFIAVLGLGACQQESASTVVCWEEPVGHVSSAGVFADKYSPEMRVVCAPINARPVGKPLVYSGPSGSAPASSSPAPGPGPGSPPSKPRESAKEDKGVARINDTEVAAYDPDTGFAIVSGDTVIAGSQQGNTDLNSIMDNLFSGRD